MRRHQRILIMLV